MSQIASRICFGMGEVLNTLIILHFFCILFLITGGGLFLTDGFSTLLIFVNFLYSSHTYQLRTQGYVILLMRYASYNSSFKLNLVLDMQFGLAKVRIRVSVRLLLHRLLLLLWQQIHLSTRISCQLSNLGHLHYILPCLLSQL